MINVRVSELSSDIIDQIAAGEVLERPSHLVKELVENSLDAGATDITVEVGQGGRQVVVTDNGIGIHSEDLTLALRRHATSKISASEDLWRLSSFGFRGEALASVAAVSHLTLSSRTSQADLGSEVESSFGKLSPLHKVGHSLGTRIAVRDLFANVPARLKFLRSAVAEMTQIKNSLKALAMAHPQVSIQLHADQELIFHWPKTESQIERIQSVLGLSGLCSGQALRESYSARAYFSDPQQVNRTSKNIWIYAQNRWIQDRGLQAAVMEAYRNLLMHGEFPSAVVFLSAAPDLIDVNVHPTKSAVKFSDPSLAFRAVQAAIRDSLQTAPWISPVQQPKTRPTQNPDQNPDENPDENPTVQPELVAVLSSPHATENPVWRDIQYKQKPDLNQASPVADKSPRESDLHLAKPVKGPIASPDRTPSGLGYWSAKQVLSQAHLTYLVVQDEKGLMLIDQHAAHERILFERGLRAWENPQQRQLEIQSYLFPLAIDVTPDGLEALLGQQPEFAKMGLDLERLGPTTLGLSAAPSGLKESALSQAFVQAAEDLVRLGGSGELRRVVGDFCASAACHSAIRAGQALSLNEMQNLLQQMDEYPLSSFCPHGRPVSILYSWPEVERDFGRLV